MLFSQPTTELQCVTEDAVVRACMHCDQVDLLARMSNGRRWRLLVMLMTVPRDQAFWLKVGTALMCGMTTGQPG
jgi:hypothetical protein